MAGDQDHFGVGQGLLGFGQNRQAVDVVHHQVGDHDVERVLLDPPRPPRARWWPRCTRSRPAAGFRPRPRRGAARCRRSAPGSVGRRARACLPLRYHLADDTAAAATGGRSGHARPHGSNRERPLSPSGQFRAWCCGQGATAIVDVLRPAMVLLTRWPRRRFFRCTSFPDERFARHLRQSADRPLCLGRK